MAIRSAVEDFEAQLEFGGGALTPDDYVEQLLERIVLRQVAFWESVYEPFMKRDLNRAQVKAIVKRGLAKSGGSYQGLVATLGLPKDDYQRFMDFLRHHDLKPRGARLDSDDSAAL